MLALYKPECLTPLEALEVLRAQHPQYRDARLAYAGRLDPLAEGVLVVLVGDETRDVAAHRGVDKAYELDVLFGVATDTYDTLGLVARVELDAVIDGDAARLALARSVGRFEQPYPPYSAARVRGRPMYHWARAGEQVAPPVAIREIISAEFVAWRTVDAAALLAIALARAGLVRGDFRQREIAARWTEALAACRGARFAVVTARVECSAGTYMRSLAHTLGASLGTCALALRIVRTRAGALTLEHALRIDP